MIMGMPIALDWQEIALRLSLTVAAGLALGFNRSEHGKAAGLRTTLLVCLAASVAMVQVNLLLPTAGRTSDSFVMNDLMRLPLGILTGVGFIGGGAILKRNDIVIGVTTAATLWFATVIGLCLGGGQIALGVVGTALALIALWPLGRLEDRLPRESTASLTIEVQRDGPSEQDLRDRLGKAGFAIKGSEISLGPAAGYRTFTFKLLTGYRAAEAPAPSFVDALARDAGVSNVQWRAPS
jgi:putative Mg2+ transporter-C (MgtC) family protein